MADMLQKGLEWLEGQRHAHRTIEVTYGRGAVTVDLLATVGKTTFEVDSGYGAVERVESRDYLIRTQDLVLASVLTLPERGDQVREVVGATTYVYEVMAPGKEPFFRYSDPHRQTLRVHTKLVKRI